jgi:hypothetical protein
MDVGIYCSVKAGRFIGLDSLTWMEETGGRSNGRRIV